MCDVAEKRYFITKGLNEIKYDCINFKQHLYLQ